MNGHIIYPADPAKSVVPTKNDMPETVFTGKMRLGTFVERRALDAGRCYFSEPFYLDVTVELRDLLAATGVDTYEVAIWGDAYALTALSQRPEDAMMSGSFFPDALLKQETENGAIYPVPVDRHQQWKTGLWNGWTPARLHEFAMLWERWRGSGMRANCEHQRAKGWHKLALDPRLPLDAQVKLEGDRLPRSNYAIHTYRSEHPRGLLLEPCSECGWRCGQGWRVEMMPWSVVTYFTEYMPYHSVNRKSSLREVKSADAE